jgi:hypothetical protein
MSTEPIELEARRLRDRIYGPQSDPNNWDGCRDKWIKDIEWLRDNAPATIPLTNIPLTNL